MNVIFKILIFSFILNISSGLISVVLPFYAVNQEYTQGISYNANMTTQFESSLNDSVNPSSQIQDAGNQIYRVLDFLKIGYIGRFINAIKSSLWGFPNLLQNLFLSFVEPNSPDSTMINGVFFLLKGVITIAYLLAVWWLWTGTRVIQ